MQPRDSWIGWNGQQRRRNLQSIVNNGRFRVLPWVHVKGLGSKILSLSARQMPRDWKARYGHRPLLLETLVDATRFRGTCYRAANWILFGQTTGEIAWTASTKITVNPSKKSISTLCSAMPANTYAAI
jgi:hypothetical protein